MNPSSLPAGPGGEMALVPSSITRVARAWDEQQVDLRVAADQVAQAPTTGFTAPVERVAADFLRAWAGHTRAAADVSEQHAVDLRAVLAAWLSTDEGAAYRSRLLLPGWATTWG